MVNCGHFVRGVLRGNSIYSYIVYREITDSLLEGEGIIADELKDQLPELYSM